MRFRLSPISVLLVSFFIVLFCASSAFPGAREKYSETVELALTLKGEKTISISTTNGDIEVRPGLGDEVKLRAVKTVRDREKSDAQEILREIEVKMEREGGQIKIYSEYQSSKINIGFGKLEVTRGLRNTRVDFYLTAPPGIVLDLGSTSGDIDVKGMKGGADINVTSGDCVLSDVSGSVRLNATSGDAKIYDLHGSLELNCTSGDMVIMNLKGDIDASSTSGDIEVKEAAGTCRLESVSGDIEIVGCLKSITGRTSSGDIVVRDCEGPLSLEASSGDILVATGSSIKGRHYLRTSSGDVTLKLRKGAGSRLDVSTSSGGIYGRLPVKIESATRHRLSGIIGKGGEQIEIETASGDIRLILQEEE